MKKKEARVDVKKKTFWGLECVKQVDELVSADLSRVLLGSSDNELQVLAQVALQQLLEAHQAIVDVQVAKELDQPCWVEERSGVDDNALDVLNVLVVLQGL